MAQLMSSPKEAQSESFEHALLQTPGTSPWMQKHVSEPQSVAGVPASAPKQPEPTSSEDPDPDPPQPISIIEQAASAIKPRPNVVMKTPSFLGSTGEQLPGADIGQS
jgi:hypothetical protein